MNKTFLLWMACLLVLAPALAEAAPAGLEYLQITPASAPENPKPVIKLLENDAGLRAMRNGMPRRASSRSWLRTALTSNRATW